MSSCKEFGDLIERHIWGELSRAERELLDAHALGCQECRRAMRAHEELSEIMNDIPEPSEEQFSEMRSGVLRRIGSASVRKSARGGIAARLLGGLVPGPAARTALAAVLTIALLAVGFAAGRVSAPKPALNDDLLISEITRLASSDEGLADYWDSPYAYSNVDARRLEGRRISLSFDVTRHIDVETTLESPLAREVMMHAILDSPGMGSRFKAMELAKEGMDSKLREVLVFTLLNDPSLPIRLGALDILRAHSSEPPVRDAILTALGQDPSVQVRFIALECLARQNVDPEVIRRAIGEADSDADRAVLERAAELDVRL